jgi:hypothetical protein
VVAGEENTLPSKKSTPTPQAESKAPAVEATLLEASIVEGEYFAQVQVTPKGSRSRQVRLIQLSIG